MLEMDQRTPLKRQSAKTQKIKEAMDKTKAKLSSALHTKVNDIVRIFDAFNGRNVIIVE